MPFVPSSVLLLLVNQTANRSAGSHGHRLFPSLRLLRVVPEGAQGLPVNRGLFVKRLGAKGIATNGERTLLGGPGHRY